MMKMQLSRSKNIRLVIAAAMILLMVSLPACTVQVITVSSPPAAKSPDTTVAASESVVMTTTMSPVVTSGIQTSTPAMTVSPTAAATSAPPSTPQSPTPSPSPYFTDGKVIVGDTSYMSQDLYVKISNVKTKDLNYYVADCRMKIPSLLFSGFAANKYGEGVTEFPLDMAVQKGAVIAIDGDYYGALDDERNHRGYVIRNGTLYRNTSWSDIAAIFKDGTMKTYNNDQITAEQLLANGATQVYSFGPALLDENGKALEKFTQHPEVGPNNPRAGIGYIEPNHFVLVVVDGRGHGDSQGLDMVNWAKVFEGLGCKCAYNLDGGGSAVMVFMGKIVNHPCDDPPTGQRAISDIIYLGEG